MKKRFITAVRATFNGSRGDSKVVGAKTRKVPEAVSAILFTFHYSESNPFEKIGTFVGFTFARFVDTRIRRLHFTFNRSIKQEFFWLSFLISFFNHSYLFQPGLFVTRAHSAHEVEVLHCTSFPTFACSKTEY